MTQALVAPGLTAPQRSSTSPAPARPAGSGGGGGGGGGGMELRKFIAPTMAECLNRVKSELGAQAVILATRNVQSRRLLGLIRREHVEITAGRGLRVPQRRRPAPAARPVATSQQPVEIAPEGKFGKGLLGTPAAASAAYLGVTQEVGELKKMVAELTEQFRNSKTPDLPEALAPLYRRLLEQQVSEPTARALITTIAEQATSEQLKDADAVRKLLVAELERKLPTTGPIARKVKGRPHVIALIGPTGVGKTTTIAKLAANLKLREGAKVALITIDTYRIAAIDQLRKYGEIIDAPLAVVSHPREVADTIARVADHDYILIDTAGRSPRDAVKLAELQQFLAAAKPDETHLVLSTTCGREAMRLALQRFAGVKADKLVFTKLDEAAELGAALDVVAECSLPVSYVTAGQDVPDDIEVARSARLARLILGEA